MATDYETPTHVELADVPFLPCETCDDRERNR